LPPADPWRLLRLQDFASHFTYPHMTVVGEDLLVVMRATAPAANITATSKWWESAHMLSSAVSRSFRVVDVRQHHRHQQVEQCTWLHRIFCVASASQALQSLSTSLSSWSTRRTSPVQTDFKSSISVRRLLLQVQQPQQQRGVVPPGARLPAVRQCAVGDVRGAVHAAAAGDVLHQLSW
jgi:hypothetical protein